VGEEAPDGSASCQYNSLAQSPSLAFPSSSISLSYFLHFFLLLALHHYKSSVTEREGGDGVEEPTAVEAGTEDGDDERRHRKKLEKGKEPAAKDVEEELLFDDTKFAVEMLRSAFRKLQGVGEAFDIKAHHDVYKDPTVKGPGFRIHELAEKLENLPVVKRAAHRHFFFDDDGSDSDDGSHGDDGDDGSHGGGTPAN
jgi:hypothetical protein